MTCLLLNMEPDLSDPRVMVAPTKMSAIHQLNALPNRVGWVVAGMEDLSRSADFAPEFLGQVTLSASDLVRVHNTFAPHAVNRFESRPVAARRTAQLLLAKFGIDNEEKAIMSEARIQDYSEEFVLAPGARVTLLPDTGKGIPEEHGVVVEVVDDMVTVEVDPLYRVSEQDDGKRDVEARECGPDPVGEMRMKAETVKTKKQIKAEIRAAKAAERGAVKAPKAPKAAKTLRAPRTPGVTKNLTSAEPTAGMTRKLLPGGQRGKIVRMAEGGATITDIAAALGLDRDQVLYKLSRAAKKSGIGYNVAETGHVTFTLPEGRTLDSFFKEEKVTEATAT